MRLPSLLSPGLAGLAFLLGGAAAAQDIYSCVDAKGRTLTADRPIAECTDRTQRTLSPSGIVTRQIEVHDRERVAALLQIDEVIKASSKRRGELADQRKSLAGELEFYAKDPSRAPASLKRRLEENEGSVAVQQRFIADQQQEKKRVNQRFDEELAKLRQLWPAASPPAPGSAGSSRTVRN